MAAKLKEVTVTYSAKVRANLGVMTYEHGDVGFTTTETWDVSGLNPSECDSFVAERYSVLKHYIDIRLMDEYNQMSCFGKPDVLEPKGS